MSIKKKKKEEKKRKFLGNNFTSNQDSFQLVLLHAWNVSVLKYMAQSPRQMYI